jgi:predicted Fe-Mo cluster-binding NifX family protein
MEVFYFMIMRIAMPVERDILSAHFGHAEKFVFFDVEDGKILSTEITSTPEHMEGSFPDWIKSNKANVIIVSGIGPKAVEIFESAGITVITNVVPDKPRKIVEDFINNKLDTSYEEVCEHDHNHDHSHHHNH